MMFLSVRGLLSKIQMRNRFSGKSTAIQIIILCCFDFFSMASLAATNNYFQPKEYFEVGSWVPPRSSPQETCSNYAAVWRWDRDGYSTKLLSVLPGMWKCQRYYLGSIEESQYTYIKGSCQINPAPIKTGSYWNYPRFDASKPLSCYCTDGQYFDYEVQWCDTAKSSRPDPSKQTGNPSALVGAPSSCHGNPINSAIGNKFQAEIDYSMSGSSFVFERYYNSYDGNWRHSFSARIIVDNDAITLIHPDGRHESFDISGLMAKSTFSPAGLFTKIDSNWVYHSADTSLMEFGDKGLPVRIKPSHGAELLLTYSSNLIYVSGLPDGTMTLSTDPLLQPLKLSIGDLQIEYIYNNAGRLTQLTRTREGQIGQRIYHYDPLVSKLLTGITDERGVRYATWSYDDQGRAISSEHADGAEKVLIAYNADGSSTVTNELGKKATYRFQTIEGVKRITAIEGEPSANCPNSNSTFTYDSRGLLKTKTNNKGHLTTYDYNERGLEVSRTEAAGTPQARTVTTDWHPSLFLPATVTEPSRITHYTYDDQGRQLRQTQTDR